MPADGAAIIAHYNRLRDDAHAHFSLCEKMAPYVAPSRVGVLTAFSPGESQTREVYDSTSMMAAELMAQFIAGHVINPSQQWGSMTMRHPAVRGSDDTQEWLEESRDRQLRAFAASSFYSEGPEALIDWGGFGTGLVLAEEAPFERHKRREGFRGFRFEAKRTGRFVIAEGASGMVDTAMDEVSLAARVIKDRFGEAKLPEAVRNALATGKPDKPFTILHAIEPRPMSEQRSGAGATAMPWSSCWVEKESKAVIHESGYRMFPGACPRYHRTPGEVFGRGRGHLAFPDTWTLNTAKRMGLEDWALKIRPPSLVRHDSIIGSLKLVPAGATSVNTRGGRISDSIMPYETGSNPQVSQIKEEELRKSIRQIFYVDQILALMEVNKSEMTAFEYAKKLELLFKLIGPVYGRLAWEFLTQIWEISFDIMYEAGAFSPPPPEVLETDGVIDVEFQNPIAKAQRAGDAESLAMATQDLTPLISVSPSTLAAFEDRLDADEAVVGTFAVRGVPARWTRSDKEVEARQQARAKQQEAANALAQTGQVAESLGKAAPMVKVLSDAGAPA